MPLTTVDSATDPTVFPLAQYAGIENSLLYSATLIDLNRDNQPGGVAGHIYVCQGGTGRGNIILELASGLFGGDQCLSWTGRIPCEADTFIACSWQAGAGGTIRLAAITWKLTVRKDGTLAIDP